MMLYVVSTLIMIRSIFRVVEYIMGHNGYPLRNEWTLYIVDALLMFGVVASFAWRFPGGVVPGRRKDRDTGEPSVELQNSINLTSKLK